MVFLPLIQLGCTAQWAPQVREQDGTSVRYADHGEQASRTLPARHPVYARDHDCVVSVEVHEVPDYPRRIDLPDAPAADFFAATGPVWAQTRVSPTGVVASALLAAPGPDLPGLPGGWRSERTVHDHWKAFLAEHIEAFGGHPVDLDPCWDTSGFRITWEHGGRAFASVGVDWTVDAEGSLAVVEGGVVPWTPVAELSDTALTDVLRPLSVPVTLQVTPVPHHQCDCTEPNPYDPDDDGCGACREHARTLALQDELAARLSEVLGATAGTALRPLPDLEWERRWALLGTTDTEQRQIRRLAMSPRYTAELALPGHPDLWGSLIAQVDLGPDAYAVLDAVTGERLRIHCRPHPDVELLECTR